MNIHQAIHICRNPYGWNDEELREARLKVCDEVERLWKENVRLLQVVERNIEIKTLNRKVL
jgi:hypothetical protein